MANTMPPPVQLSNDGSGSEDAEMPDTHPNFPASPNTDVIFESSDGQLFHLHRKNLDTHSTAFPGPEIQTEPDEVTDLTEPGDVLAIAFNFCYPRKQADIEKMGFQIVMEVAEAVEKYQIFSAMKVCEMRLKQLIPDYPAEILTHGIKHGYPALIEGALPYLSRKPLVTVLEKLPVHYHLIWCRYHQEWANAFRAIIRETVKVADQNYLSLEISQILDWEAIDNVSTLKRTLQEVVNSPEVCQRCHGGNMSGFGGFGGYSDVVLKGHTKKAAERCLAKIAKMPGFSFFKSD